MILFRKGCRPQSRAEAFVLCPWGYELSPGFQPWECSPRATSPEGAPDRTSYKAKVGFDGPIVAPPSRAL